MARTDRNGLRSPRPSDYPLPKSAEEAIKLGLNVYIDNGVEKLLRYKSRAKQRENGLRYEEEKVADRKANRGSERRRAATNQQTLTKEDYRNYAKKNGYTEELADQLYTQNEAKLSDLKKQKSVSQNYEHLTPTISKKYGGVEHWRNITLMDAEENGAKSDKLISKDAAVQAGIPLNKQSALQMDFEGRPDLPLDEKLNIVRESLEKAVSARQVNAAYEKAVARYNNKPTPSLKYAKATALAAAGIGLLGPLGTAASAAEVAERTAIANGSDNLVDDVQAGLAGVSLAADGASYVPVAAPVGELVSTAADGVNMAIDTVRQNPETITKAKKKVVETAQTAVKTAQTANKTLNPVSNAIHNNVVKPATKKLNNEVTYFFARLRQGRVPYISD